MASTSKSTAGAIRYATRLFNPVSMLLAGSIFLPLYGVLQHRGRRSGKLFRTPVVVVRSNGGFIVPMPWGETTDWYRNVRAAGECVIRWKGRDYPVFQPEVIDSAEAGAAFNSIERAGMSRFGIKRCLRLRDRDVASEPGTGDEVRTNVA